MTDQHQICRSCSHWHPADLLDDNLNLRATGVCMNKWQEGQKARYFANQRQAKRWFKRPNQFPHTLDIDGCPAHSDNNPRPNP